MAFRSRAIGPERLAMLRGVLDSVVLRMGVARGTKEHEELAVRLLQLADFIPEKERLIEALSRSVPSRNRLQPAPRPEGARPEPRTAA